MSKNIISLDSIDFGNSVLDGDSELLGNDLPVTEEPNSEDDGTTEETEESTEESGSTETEEGTTSTEESTEEVPTEEEGNSGADEETEEETIEAIVSELGFKLPEGKVYSQDTSGIREAILDLKPSIIEEAAAEFFEEMPLMAEYARAKASGMSDIEWARQLAAQEVDYSMEEIPVDNEQIQEAVVRNNLKNKGYTGDRLERQIKRIKDADELYEESQAAYEEDRQAQVQSRTEQEAAAKEAAKLAKKEQDEYIERQRDLIVKQGKIGNVNIPAKEREAFFAARFARNDKGTTALAEKIAAMSEEKRAELDYMIWKDFNVTAQAEKVANTKKATSLLRKANTSKGASAMSNGKRAERISGNVPSDVLNYIPTNTI